MNYHRAAWVTVIYWSLRSGWTRGDGGESGVVLSVIFQVGRPPKAEPNRHIDALITLSPVKPASTKHFRSLVCQPTPTGSSYNQHSYSAEDSLTMTQTPSKKVRFHSLLILYPKNSLPSSQGTVYRCLTSKIVRLLCRVMMSRLFS